MLASKEAEAHQSKQPSFAFRMKISRERIYLYKAQYWSVRYDDERGRPMRSSQVASDARAHACKHYERSKLEGPGFGTVPKAAF